MLKYLILLFLSIFILTAQSEAEEINTRYFSLLLFNCDTNAVANKLGVKENKLKDTLDNLLLEASELIGISITDFHSRIKIYAGREKMMSQIFREYKYAPNVASIYILADDIIFTSAADLNLFLLAHEFTHALLSKYFVVHCPEEMQEILAGYVEYQIRKTRGRLP